jgi:sugar O-acyltransferase (sialic acid O-acetyltransferase NeuD family)
MKAARIEALPPHPRVASIMGKHLQDIILIGGGGHCRSCIDVIEAEGRFTIRGIIDANVNLPSPILNYELLGGEADIARLSKFVRQFFITVGHTKEWGPRVRLYDYLKSLHVTLPTIVSPLAHVSKHAVLEEGSIVMHQAIVNSGARVGRNCIVNSKALLEHDALIEEHCHISTAAVVNGGAMVRRRSFVGSNAVIREGIEVGESCVIGAGMVVMRDVPSWSMLKFHRHCVFPDAGAATSRLRHHSVPPFADPHGGDNRGPS